MERKIHFFFMIVWAIMLPITMFTGLRASVPYVAAISVWALIASHAAAWAATKAGEKAAEAVHHHNKVYDAILKLHRHHGLDRDTTV